MRFYNTQLPVPRIYCIGARGTDSAIISSDESVDDNNTSEIDNDSSESSDDEVDGWTSKYRYTYLCSILLLMLGVLQLPGPQ